MTPEWLDQATATATLNWQNKAREKFGTPYSHWQNAANKKAKCQRIGFGNDDAGNIGNTVTCHFTATPCAKL